MENLPYEKLLDEYHKDFTISIPFIISSMQELNRRAGYVYNGGSLLKYTFSLRDGCSEDEIKAFEKNIGYPLPEDYRQFLFYTNGLGLSEYVGSWILDIDLILEVFRKCYPKNILCIAEYDDGDTRVLIDLNQDSDKCVYICEVMLSDELRPINCNFTEFLNRFITTYGLSYWHWM